MAGPEVGTVSRGFAKLIGATTRVPIDDTSVVELDCVGIKGGAWWNVFEGLPYGWIIPLEGESNHLG